MSHVSTRGRRSLRDERDTAAHRDIGIDTLYGSLEYRSKAERARARRERSAISTSRETTGVDDASTARGRATSRALAGAGPPQDHYVDDHTSRHAHVLHVSLFFLES